MAVPQLQQALPGNARVTLAMSLADRHLVLSIRSSKSIPPSHLRSVAEHLLSPCPLFSPSSTNNLESCLQPPPTSRYPSLQHQQVFFGNSQATPAREMDGLTADLHFSFLFQTQSPVLNPALQQTTRGDLFPLSAPIPVLGEDPAFFPHTDHLSTTPPSPFHS